MSRANLNKVPRTPTKNIALALLTGLLAGLLGLAPWLSTGAQLPLQNLWDSEVPPQQMPMALLPLSQYKLTSIVALLTVGGALAGLAVQLLPPVRRRLATWCATAGVLVVQVGATVQAFEVANAGLAPGARSSLYLAGLLGGVLTAIVASLVALLLIASKSKALTSLGVGLMAVPFASWIGEWAINLAGVGDVSPVVPFAARWLPAVVVGVALAWCGLRPANRALVWLANLALLWVVPAVFTSVNYVFGTRIVLGELQEMALMGGQFLSSALGPDGGAGLRVLLALAIGLAGTASRDIPSRRRLKKRDALPLSKY